MHRHTRTYKFTGWSYVFPAAGGWTVINCSSFLSCCFRRTLPCLDCKYIHFFFQLSTHFSSLSVDMPTLFIFSLLCKPPVLLRDRVCYNNILHSMVSISLMNVGFGLVWFGLNTIKEQLRSDCSLLECHQVSLTFRLITWSVWSVHCDFHCTYCLEDKMNWTSGNLSSLHIVGSSCQIICSYSVLFCLWENPLVAGSWCDIGTRTKGHIRLRTLVKVKGCLLLNEVVECHRISPQSSLCQWTHIPPSEWDVSSQFSIGFHSLRPILYCLTPTHPDTHAVRESQSNANFYSHLQQGSMCFYFFFFGIISVPVARWSFQLPLFQFRLPGAYGNNETVGHGKIISLPSIHLVILLTHDPDLSPASVYLAFDV